MIDKEQLHRFSILISIFNMRMNKEIKAINEVLYNDIVISNQSISHDKLVILLINTFGKYDYEPVLGHLKGSKSADGTVIYDRHIRGPTNITQIKDLLTAIIDVR